MPESYKPGERKARFGVNHQMTDDRYAWITCEAGKFLILVGEDKGSGSDVVIHHPRPGKMPDLAIKLSILTEPELDALEELFMSAFAWARPVVKQRDKEAADAYEQGDDSYSRSYRALPTVVYRKRAVAEYREGIQDRPDGVSERGRGTREDHPGGIRGARPILVELDEVKYLPEDDSEETD